LNEKRILEIRKDFPVVGPIATQGLDPATSRLAPLEGQKGWMGLGRLAQPTAKGN
jgi:hypothetical protein